MARRERRLWLGNWQQDADGDDVVLIEPDDEVDPEPEPERPDRRRAWAAGVAVAVLALIVGFALSSGGGSDKRISAVIDQAQTPQPQPQFQPPQQQAPQAGGGFGGADLTGAEAQKAAASALRRFPGSIERVTPGPGGAGYVVHVISPDGYETHVFEGPDFKIEGSDGNQPGGGVGPGAIPGSPG